jgi:Co/Zn/Cd efflux system component
LADILHAKAKIAGVADEVQPTYRTLVITALATFGAGRWENKIVLLIKPDSWDFDPGEFGQPADADINHKVLLEPLAARDFMLRNTMTRSEMSQGGAGSCHCQVKFDGLSQGYKARLWAVIMLNASMFAVETGAGVMAGSQALQADALDFLGDTLTYGMSLAVIGLSLRVRSMAALIKGTTLALMGLWVLASTFWHALVLGVPHAEVMGLVGVFALATNLASVLILLKYRDGDANVRSVWLCSRNDAIGNIAVMLAAVGVWGTATGWPDVLVAAIIASLFLNSASNILRQALNEWRLGKDAHPLIGAVTSYKQ